jgi:hypothetical protein
VEVLRRWRRREEPRMEATWQRRAYKVVYRKPKKYGLLIFSIL